MTIYCDESGGLSAGAMVFAAVSLTPDAAHAIHDRFRSVTGLRGELKGSRIGIVERAYLIELFDRFGGRAWVAIANLPALARSRAPAPLHDLQVYTALLDQAVGQWLPETGGVCTDVVIDEGRYDPVILDGVRSAIQKGLGGWGQASLADSKRSEGIQIADVIANSCYNIEVQSQRAARIALILAPLRESRAIRTSSLDHLP